MWERDDPPDRAGTGLEGTLQALDALRPGTPGVPSCWTWACRAVVADVHDRRRAGSGADLEFEAVLVRRLAHRYVPVVDDAAAGRAVPRAWQLLLGSPAAAPARLALAGVVTLLGYDLPLAFAGTCTVLGRDPGARERDAHGRVAALLGTCGRDLVRRTGTTADVDAAARLGGPARPGAAGRRAECLWRLRGRPAEAEAERDALDREVHAAALRVLAGGARGGAPACAPPAAGVGRAGCGEPCGVSISPAAAPGRTPLSPAPAMWTPSAGTRCGVAQYAEELVTALRGIGCPATHTAAPDPSAAVLHLQHEHSLVAPERVAEVARHARDRGASLVVTEHTVRGETDAWEGDVAALVAHSAEGAALLRQRWPGQRIEVVPHGCPTLFPPRKPRRGRVVATFGFLEPHKGLAGLLDAAAALGDVELLLVGSTRAAWADEWFAGLDLRVPVRRVAEFLDEDEIARLLAAEADVLVFPYAQPRFNAVSGAVRVGLTSGVPVLTSPTTWFSDLRHATLQTDDLAGGIARLLDDTALREQLSGAAREHCHANSWPRTARRHADLYAALR